MTGQHSSACVNQGHNKLLIYLHIPKTGGTTLTNIICNQYTRNIHYRDTEYPQGVLFYKEQLPNADTLCGHFWFGVHFYFSREFTYITMLRDPIERVISWFYFRYKNPQYDHSDMSFEEYISCSSDEFNYFTSNFQTRFLCGGKVSNGNISELKAADLQAAKENLSTYFSIVGITELFDESVFLMKKVLGWNCIPYQNINVNKNRPSINQFSKETIDKLMKKNELDLELYYDARKLLEQTIEALDPQDKQELVYFKTNK